MENYISKDAQYFNLCDNVKSAKVYSCNEVWEIKEKLTDLELDEKGAIIQKDSEFQREIRNSDGQLIEESSTIERVENPGCTQEIFRKYEYNKHGLLKKTITQGGDWYGYTNYTYNNNRELETIRDVSILEGIGKGTFLVMPAQ